MGTEVLVVDANREFAILIRQSLEEGGQYNVSVANSGVDALTLAAEKSFDLAIIDLDLPDIEGRKVIRRLREGRPGLKLVVIPVSGPDELGEQDALSVEKVLSKPFYLPDLPKILQETLETSPVRPQRRAVDDKDHRVAELEDQFEAGAAEYPSLIPSREEASKRLVTGLASSDAKAAVLLRDRRPIAQAGEISAGTLREVAGAIPDPPSRRTTGELVRFLRLTGRADDFLLYGAQIGDRLNLALLFPADMPIGVARKQTARLARMLIEAPAEGAQEVPLPPESEAEDIEPPAQTIAEAGPPEAAEPRPAQAESEQPDVEAQPPQSPEAKAVEPPAPQVEAQEPEAPEAVVDEARPAEAAEPRAAQAEGEEPQVEPQPPQPPEAKAEEQAPPQVKAEEAEIPEPEALKAEGVEAEAKAPAAPEPVIDEAGPAEAAEPGPAQVEAEEPQVEAQPPQPPEVKSGEQAAPELEAEEAEISEPEALEAEGAEAEAKAPEAPEPVIDGAEIAEAEEPEAPQVTIDEEEPPEVEAEEVEAAAVQAEVQPEEADLPAPQAEESVTPQLETAEAEVSEPEASEPRADKQVLPETSQEAGEPEPEAELMPADWVPKAQPSSTQELLFEQWAELEPPEADPEPEGFSEPQGEARSADEMAFPTDWIPQQEAPEGRLAFFDDLLTTRERDAQVSEANGEAERAPESPPAQPTSYHLTFNTVLIPRFPEHELTGSLAQELSQWARRLCLAWDWRADWIRVEPQALHLQVSLIPQSAPGQAVERLMQDLSERIIERYPKMQKELPSGRFWARPYLLTAGDPPKPEQVLSFIRRTRQAQGFEV